MRDLIVKNLTARETRKYLVLHLVLEQDFINLPSGDMGKFNQIEVLAAASSELRRLALCAIDSNLRREYRPLWMMHLMHDPARVPVEF